MLLDIHHHHAALQPDILSIRSFHPGEADAFAAWPAPCSVGLHPWYVATSALQRAEQWEWLVQAADAPQVLLLGECGLDALRGPDLAVQQAVFEQCLLLAEQLRKPLLIHCVRAYEALLQRVNRQKTSVPLIIHGFARKPSVLQPLLRAGFYISFGAAILREQGAAAQSLAQVPLEKLFLESDDKMLHIAELYARTAQIKGLELAALEEQIERNWQTMMMA